MKNKYLKNFTDSSTFIFNILCKLIIYMEFLEHLKTKLKEKIELINENLILYNEVVI